MASSHVKSKVLGHRWRVVCALVVLTLAAALLPVLLTTAGAQEEEDDLTDLSFLIDGSGSISSSDWDLQQEGFANALQDPVAFPLDGTIAVGVVQWAGGTTQQEIPLTVLDSEATRDQLITDMQAVSQIGGGTNPGDGVRAGTDELIADGREQASWSLCMSTDGTTNSGESLDAATTFAQDNEVDRYSVVAFEDPGIASADDFHDHYGPHVFGGGTVSVARNVAEFATLFSSGCLNPELEVVGLEVNQAVQDWENSVNLVEDKATVVRAFVQTPADESDSVRTSGQLFGKRDGADLPGSPLNPLNSGGTVLARNDVADRRGALHDSLNFRLPDSWQSGDVELELELPSLEGCLEAAPPINTCSADVSFEPTAPLDLKIARVRWEDSGGTIQSPTGTQLVEQGVRTRQIFPLSDVNLALGTLGHTFSGSPGLGDVNSRLETMRLLDLCWDIFGCDTLYYGVLTGGGGGLANGIPGTASSGFLSGSGARTGTGYARNRGPHEVAHTLGQHHAVHSSNGLNSDGNKQGWCGSVASTSAPDHPFSASIAGSTRALIGPIDDQDTEIWGMDPRFLTTDAHLALVNPRDTFALLGYCGPLAAGQGRWIDRGTYDRLADEFAVTISSTGTPQDVTAAAETDYLIVRGTIDLDTDDTEFDPFQSLTSDTPPPGMDTGDYTLELRDNGGGVIDSVDFEPIEMDTDEPAGGSTGDDPVIGLFLLPVEDPGPTLDSAVILRDGTELAAVTASDNAPNVGIDTPSGGETFDQDNATFEWTGTDADGDDLFYTVQYSDDDGASWDSLVVDLPQDELTVERFNLPGSSQARLRVMASDGVHTTTDTSPQFTVADNAPLLTIENPEDGEAFSGAQEIFFEATALDPEDGAIDGGDLAWSSDLDGSLGTGTELNTNASDLQEGTHQITATATDSGGNSTQDTREIEVARLADPPPAPGLVAGTVTDSHSGDPIENAIVTVIDGGTTTTAPDGTYAVTSLPPETYEVEVSADDYQPASFDDVVVEPGEETTLNVQLDPVPGAVAGTVTDADSGDPVDGTEVTVDGTSATTDANGDYTIDGLVPDTYDLTVTATDYEDATVADVDVEPDTTTTVDVALDPVPADAGAVAGTVTDADSGDPVDGAEVTVDGTSATTDANGDYTIGGLVPDTYDLTVTATDYEDATVTDVDVEPDTTTTVDVALTLIEESVEPQGPAGVSRLSGPGRLDTAVEVSRDGFEDGAADAAVLARADDYSDALAGTPLAVDRDAPLLLSPSNALHATTAAELERVLGDSGTVALLGGTAALSDDVAAAVEDLGYTVERFAGATRFETALDIADRGLDNPGTVLLATGRNFPDGLSAGAAAAAADGSVLLTESDQLPASVAAYLTTHTPTTFAVGGPAAQAAPSGAQAVSGSNRFATARAVAERFFTDPTAVGVASGEDFADALTGGAHIGRLGGPLVVTQRTELHTTIRDYLDANRASLTHAFVYGGGAALDPAVETAVQQAIE